MSTLQIVGSVACFLVVAFLLFLIKIGHETHDGRDGPDPLHDDGDDGP